MIKLLTFFTTVFLILSATLQAQQKRNYVHMKGKLGNSVRVTADIQRSGPKMEGNYCYNLYVDDSLFHLSAITTLYGDIDKHNRVVFKRLSANDTSFTGLFTDHRFTGFWHGPDSTKLPFDWKETSPAGTLPLEVFYLHSDKTLVPKAQGSPTAEIELTLLYPPQNTKLPASVVDSVKKFIQKQFFGEYQPSGRPDDLMSRSEQDFYTRFAALNSRWKTNRKQGFNMEKKEQMRVVFNERNLICLQYEKRGYAGRGNPMVHLSYDMIDLRNGKKLSLSEIFKPEAEKALYRLINKKIRDNNGLSGSLSLKNTGFYTDSLPVTRNISFNGNGLYFVYNVYDVAPPALGLQKVFLPFSEIKSFIKPSCVLFPFAGNEP